MALIKACYARLREAEQRILLVTGTDDEGRPALQPFPHTATDAPPAEVKRPGLRKKTNDPTMPF